MNYIIFDWEWNRPADERSTVQDPVHLHGEIVEIGAVKLDENFYTFLRFAENGN